MSFHRWIRRFAVLIIVLIIWAGFGAVYCVAQDKPFPKAINGVLDLSDWDFEMDGSGKLQGDWEFYWEKLIKPESFSSGKLPDKTGYINMPSLWGGYVVNGKPLGNDGYATFRLVIKLKKSSDVGIFMPEAFTSYNLWANDVLLSANGKVGMSKDTTVPKTIPGMVFYKDDDKQINLVLQVANFHSGYGGLWRDIIIGSPAGTKKDWSVNLAISMALFGCLFIIGLYHIIYFIFRKKDISLLYFGLLCLDISFGNIVTDQKFLFVLLPEFRWELMYKFDYLVVCLASPLFMTFVYKIFPGEVNRKALITFNCIACGFGLLVLGPDNFYDRMIIVYYNTIQMIAAAYVAYCMILAIKRKRQNAGIIFVGYIILVITVLNDILHANMVIKTGYYVSIGLTVFVLLQSLILAMRYSSAFVSIDELNNTLDILKNTQEQLVRSGKMSVITRLVSGVAHEINTPLGVGITASSTLVYKTDEMMALYNENMIGKSKLEGYLNDVNEVGRLMLDSLTQAAELIKNFKMLSVDLTDEKKQLVKMKACLGEIFNSLSSLQTKCGHSISFICNEEFEIVSYRGAFFQIISNLMLNSLMHGYDGGVCGKIEISLEKRDDKVYLTYADDGKGIGKEFHEKIFEPFYTTGRASGRVGLGLNIVYNIVTQTLGGNIKVESEPGQGTMFIIDFPVEPLV